MFRVFAESKTFTIKGSTGTTMKVNKSMKVKGNLNNSLKKAKVDMRTKMGKAIKKNGQRVTRGRMVTKKK